MLLDICPFINMRGDEERMSGVGVEVVQRRERSDAVRSREKVMDAARRLFGERGVDAVSMYEIGREAGVGQGTLYRRFEHKGALCSALLGEKIEDFQEESQHRVGSRGAALGRLKWFLGRLARFNEENGALLGAVRDAAGGGRRIEMHRNPFYEGLRGLVIELLREAKEAGDMRTDLDSECLADTLLAAINIDLYVYQRQELGMERERIVGSLRSVLEGLRVTES